MSGPVTAFSEQLHATKHRGPGESFREAMNRIASALTHGDHFHEFRDILLDQRFLPAGRVQLAVGSTRKITPYNCYVSGTIEDSFVDGEGSIMRRASEAAQTMRMGGGIGYDFSTLRPRGAEIRKLGSRSSGPVAFMEIFDAICRCVASSGHRRGAQMGVMRVDHPDIEEFVRAKQNSGHLTGFNVSVALTDEFMRCVEEGLPFALRWGGREYREVDAKTLWETIMRSTWDWAEPGVLFVDRINEMNNLRYCETIAATNPCGEQPLPPHGACLLGSFNLVRYLADKGTTLEGRKRYLFNGGLLQDDVRHVVRAMDTVIDVANYPLYEQEKEARSKRRMGLGVTGLANAGEALGYYYGNLDFLAFEEQVLATIRDAAYTASAELAAERGPFPLYREWDFGNSKFVQTLPEHVRNLILKHGIRNSHLLSIAPCGTISMCADNVSSGIEPVFDYEVERTLIGEDGPVVHQVVDYGWGTLGVRGKRSADVTVEEHLNVLAVAQRYVDSAVSKTLNVPSDLPWEEFKAVYTSAWKLGAKGCTTFQVGGKRQGVVRSAAQPPAAAACYVDSATGKRECE